MSTTTSAVWSRSKANSCMGIGQSVKLSSQDISGGHSQFLLFALSTTPAPSQILKTPLCQPLAVHDRWSIRIGVEFRFEIRNDLPRSHCLHHDPILLIQKHLVCEILIIWLVVVVVSQDFAKVA